MTFRHMEATDALKDYAKERLDKIRKFLPDPIAMHVVMSTERFKHHVDVNLQLHNGFLIAGRESSEDMYSSIDRVTAKIESQVRRYKDKLRTHKSRAGVAPLVASHSILVEEDHVPAATAAVAAEPQSPIIPESEKFHATPMSPADAIMQLNLLGEHFLVFRNEESGQVNVIYRRDDDGYGLIETTAAPS
ncbi:MAG TPA: ribosome-associated translation inhibitor RaiA [Kofleriaceae bacterium]|nr:ribosome-associated translation inhibitor RaiA [Kofleriaceae bacterium]